MIALLLCAIALIILIVIVVMRARRSEDFANIDEKTARLAGWIGANRESRYTEFIAANPESNIVEYAHLRQLESRGMLHDPRALRKVLSVQSTAP